MPELKAIESEAIRTPAASNIITFFTEEDGNIVLKAKRNDGSVETLVGKAEGNLELYRCASVGGPYVAEGYIVSGAGKEEVNGNYVLTDMQTDAETPIYKHESREYYYFDILDEQGICTSPIQSPGSGLYYNLWGEGWMTGSSGVDPAPSVNKGKFTANANAPKTWSGNKAVWSDAEGYRFEETATEGLTYGSALTPEIGKVYDSQATMVVNLFAKYPSDAVLSNCESLTDKHLSFVNCAVDSSNNKLGSASIKINTDGYITFKHGKTSLVNTPWTAALYFYADSYTGGDGVSPLINNDNDNSNTFYIGLTSDGKIKYHIRAGSQGAISSALSSGWHHIRVVHIVDKNLLVYLDGNFIKEISNFNYTGTNFWIGKLGNGSSYQFAGNIDAVEFYEIPDNRIAEFSGGNAPVPNKEFNV